MSNELAWQVSITLGDYVADYDVPGIVAELCERFGPLENIDAVETDAYWEVVRAHDVTEHDDETEELYRP